ncbi:myosin essential light chain, striated adductor muscle-like [Haliotis rubra]|uniref:myosin essential light chain, striated adductor muscle-like n=1 Tax=Haliotis rubra TaxID=36100 RepID=UPI001EE5E2FD|nr:myosin essential light chain, striated adductor muscle-like [Haliotis rubra]
MSMSREEREELEDVREVFDLFDFWDGRDGLIDAIKVGDLLRCMGLNPTLAQSEKLGGTKATGQKQYAFEEVLSIFKQAKNEKEKGTYRAYVEAFKSFDREGQGYISLAEMNNMLTAMGERLPDESVSEILKLTDTREDIEGNLKYEEFIKKVMKGPDGKEDVI